MPTLERKRNGRFARSLARSNVDYGFTAAAAAAAAAMIASFSLHPRHFRVQSGG